MKKGLIFLLFFLVAIFAQNKKIYLCNIEGDIDLGLIPYINRVIDEADKADAAAIIFRINTFGGRVDAATQIKDAIINCPVQTIAFIDKRAISAGALISLSCEKIVMVPGASIGASTVVDQAGKKQAEKYQSYMRGEMRSTAEKNNRPADIAEGMVDERIVVEGLVDSSQLITLTTNEALKWEIADTTLNDFEEVAGFLGINKAEFIVTENNLAEGIIRFLNHPIISSLLIMIGMIGFFAEIKSPGWGLPGTAALISLTLFFGSGYILQLASIIEILIFVIGVCFIIAEIFVIPGFGIFGIVGILAIVASLFLGLLSDFDLLIGDMLSAAVIQLAITLSISFVIILFLFRWLPSSSVFNRLVLADNIDATSGYTSEHKFEKYLNFEGTALTDLRPSGTIKIENERFDVVTFGDYISKGDKIKVVKVEGSKIVVEKI